MWHESRVILFDVSEVIAEVARDIVRTTASARPRGRIIRGADAVYLATADFSGADTLVTHDSALLAHSGMLRIHICPPSVLYNELSKTTMGGDPTS